MDPNTELEAWSYMKMCLAERDSNGKFVIKSSKRSRKERCPLGKKIVSSPFFRSIVYHIDHLIITAKDILDYRRRDLEEFNAYVEDEQVEDDLNYRHELAREIVYWTKMVDLYESIKSNKDRWFKEGKFPWSGIRVSTPYYDAPPLGMSSKMRADTVQDSEMTPVDAENNFLQVELEPVSKDGNHSKASRTPRNRKRSSRSKRSRIQSGQRKD